MALGRERSLLIANPIKRAVIAVIGDLHFGRVLRFITLKRVIAKATVGPSAILDAGCGKGYMTIYLAQTFPNARVVGIDISEPDLFEGSSISHAGKFDNLCFVKSDLQYIACSSVFDLVISSEVLECIPNDVKALQNLYFVLRLNGVLILHLMHAKGAYETIGFRKLQRREPSNWCDTGQVRAGYLMEDLKQVLNEVGFSDINIDYTFGPVGMLGHSMFEIARNWPIPIYLFIFPCLVALCFIDSWLPNSHGGGMLITARKDFQN